MESAGGWRAVNFYPFNIGDFAAATRHLSWDESMAYRVLLDAYYSREEPLPLDVRMVYRLAGAVAPKHRQAVDAVLSEFFVKDQDGYRNARCDEEIIKTQVKKEKAKSSAAKRWSGTQQSEGNADAMRTHMPTHSEGNAPNPNPSIEEDAADSAGARAGAREGPTFELVDLALADIAELGSHPVRGNPVIAPIWQLVQSGFDLKTQIVPSIRRQIAKAKYPVQRWSYFVQGIVEDAQKIAVKPLEAKPNGSHRPNSIAGGFDLIERAIAAEEQAIAEAEGRHGGSEVHPVAIPGLRQGAA